MSQDNGLPTTREYHSLRWLQRLPTADLRTRTDFALWIRQSPKNLHAYFRHKALTTELKGIDAQHRFDVRTLIERARGHVFSPAKIIPSADG